MSGQRSRNGSRPLLRLLGGAIVIIVVFIGFLAYQFWQMNKPTQVAVVPSPTASATPEIALALTDIAATPTPSIGPLDNKIPVVKPPSNNTPNNTSNNAAATAAATTNDIVPRPPSIVRVAAENANLVTEIIEVPFSKTEDNWDLTYLNQFAGHLEGTDLIGQGGNFVLAGHVEMKDGSRGPFADIHLLNPGDLITVMSNVNSAPILAQYRVTSVKSVKPNSLPEIQNHGVEELTLLTCGDWDQRNHVYQTRVVVHAQVVFLRHALAFDPTTRAFKVG